MEARNPYAPPGAEVRAVKADHCKRQGKYVVIPTGCDFPARCIVCNEPAEGPGKEMTLRWHSPWLYLLILVHVLVYVIVALFVRKSVRVSPRLCEEHTALRNRRLRIFGGSGGAALIAGIGLLMMDRVDAAPVFFALAFLMLIVAGLTTRKVYARKVTKEYACLGGCKTPFLSSLETREP